MSNLAYSSSPENMLYDKENDITHNKLKIRNEGKSNVLPAKRQALSSISINLQNADKNASKGIHKEVLSDKTYQYNNNEKYIEDFDVSLSSHISNEYLNQSYDDKNVLMVSLAEDPLLENLSNINSCLSPMVVSEINDDAKMRSLSPSLKGKTPPLDIFCIPEYSHDVLIYLKQMEILFRPRANYMSKQPDITYVMRATVIDWLVEVAVEYKLLDQTLYLACSYIDRFLSIMAISRSKLQLLGTTCMFIAAKFEEIYPPDINEFVYITDGTYTKEQVIRMEQLILKILSFRVCPPTNLCFLEKFCKLSAIPKTAQLLAKFLSELTLLDGEVYLKYEPSIIASAAICLSNMCLQREPWGIALQKHSGYTYTTFLSCLKDLYKTMCFAHQQAQQHKAIYEKYQTIKMDEVAKIQPPPPYNLLLKD